MALFCGVAPVLYLVFVDSFWRFLVLEGSAVSKRINLG